MRPISCCQHSQSCSKLINDWLSVSSSTIITCRHNSNGIMGAIREDNADLVHYFLHTLDDADRLIDIFLHETNFGDTLLSFAACLGRCEIITVLINALSSIIQTQSDNLTIADFVNLESSRGKTPIIEAVKHGRIGVVSILLKYEGNAKLPSKVHNKSALDWAVSLGHDAIASLIIAHCKLEEEVTSLLKAVSKGDESLVKSLTDGGVSYELNQKARFQQDLDSRHYLVDRDMNSKAEMTEALQEAQQSKSQLLLVLQRRETHIKCLVAEREDIAVNRRNEVMAAIVNVRLALSKEDNIVSDIVSSPQAEEYELISKALCNLLHIKIDKRQTNMPYWREIRDLLQDKTRFYHRIRHYNFEVEMVELAKDVEADSVNRLPGTISQLLPSMLNTNANDTEVSADRLGGSVLMITLARWLDTQFNHVLTHKLEKDLLMQESGERDLLERNRIDGDLLASQCTILNREINDLSASIHTNATHISQLQRKLEVSAAMKFVASESSGHSVLSWAAAANGEIVKLLIKRGAHTAIEDIKSICATIIQVAYRQYHRTNTPSSSTCVNVRWDYALAISLRIKSLGNLIRQRMRRLHLPLANALYNGHTQVATILNGSDVPNFQALNLFHLFQHPQGTIPKSPINLNVSSSEIIDNSPSNRRSEQLILSCIIEAGQRYSHEQDHKDVLLSTH